MVKDEERILNAERKNKLVTYSRILIRLSADFSKETLQARGIVKKYSKSQKAGTHSQDCSAQQSYYLQSKGR